MLYLYSAHVQGLWCFTVRSINSLIAVPQGPGSFRLCPVIQRLVKEAPLKTSITMADH